MSLMGDIINVGSLGLLDPEGDAEDAARAGREAAELGGQAALAAKKEDIDFQKWLWGEQTALQEPYMAAGKEGLAGYQQMLGKGFDYDQYADPSTQFRKEEGQKAIESSAAAKGMSLSGKGMKDLLRYGQDYASTEYGNAYSRWQDSLTRKYNLAAMGQAAASGVSGAGTAMGGQVSRAIQTGGQAQAGMYQDIGNIQAAQAMGPWNMAMDIAGLGASLYRGG